MAVFIATFGKLITIFIYILAGFVVARKKIFSEIFTNGISSFLMTVSVPCLIITSFQVEYTSERLRLGGIAFLASVIIIAVGIGIGYLNAYLLRVPVSDKAVWVYSTAFPNHVFMGWPVMAAIFGQEAIFYAAFANLAFSAYAYTFGIWIFQKYGQKGEKKQSLRSVLLTPINVALVIAMIMFVTGLRLPASIEGAVDGFGSITTPLAMFYVGTILAANRLREVFADRRVYMISFLRLILVPLLVLFLARPFVSDPISYGTLVIGNAMPVAAYCAIYAGAYRNNVQLASRFVSVTSILCLATIPLFAVLLELM